MQITGESKSWQLLHIFVQRLLHRLFNEDSIHFLKHFIPSLVLDFHKHLTRWTFGLWQTTKLLLQSQLLSCIRKSYSLWSQVWKQCMNRMNCVFSCLIMWVINELLYSSINFLVSYNFIPHTEHNLGQVHTFFGDDPDVCHVH